MSEESNSQDTMSTQTEQTAAEQATAEQATEEASPYEEAAAAAAEPAAGERVDAEAALTAFLKTDVSRGRRKVRIGYVVSDKMDKTVIVAVEDRVKHKLYGKVMRQTLRLKAHDEANEAGVGDRVVVMETRPRSATKRWRLVQIVEKAR